MLISRHGSQMKCPEWFIEQFPKEFTLDGELWNGRGTFEMLIATINSKDSIGWKGIELVVFDFPNSGDPYELRIRNLFKLTLPNHVQIVDVSRCRGNDDIIKYLSTIVNLGGEGIMAIKHKSLYKPMRVEWLFKVKVTISQIDSILYFLIIE